MKISNKMFNLNQFEFVNNEYIYSCDLDNHYYCVIKIINNELKSYVYDSLSHEEYLPFNIKSNTGSFSASLHEKVDKIIENLKLDNSAIVNELFKFIYEKYQTTPDYPFPNDATSATFKKNNKWFLLYMNVSSKSLGLNDIKNINIINIKLNPEEIPNLIDNVIFFKAYHMNKKNWITIDLDNISSIEEIADYIDKSFNLV